MNKKYRIHRRHPGRFVLMALSFALPVVAEALTLRAPVGAVMIGQPIRIAIPLEGEDAERIDVTCFRLISPRQASNAEFVLRDAELVLERRERSTRLWIESRGNWREPVLEFALAIDCGGQRLVREFSILADPGEIEPPAAAIARSASRARQMETPTKAASASPVASAPRPPVSGIPGVGQTREAMVAPGDGEEILTLGRDTNLNAIARQRYPDDRAARDAFRARVAAANLELFAGKGPVGRVPLPAGTVLHIPPAKEEAEPAPPQPAVKLGAGGTAPPVKKADRLMIGAVPATKNPTAEMTAALERLESLLERQGRREEEIAAQLAAVEQSFAALSQTLLTLEEKVKRLDEEQAKSHRERQELIRQVEEAKVQAGFGQLLLTILVSGIGVAAGLYLIDRWRRRRFLATTEGREWAAAGPAAESRIPPRNTEPSLQERPQTPPARQPSVIRTEKTASPVTRPVSAMEARSERPASSSAASDGTLQSVQAMVSAGLYLRAAETLVAAIQRDPASAAELWSLLRDIYQRYDLEDEQLKTAIRELRAKLNIVLPWEEHAPGIGESLIDYPHVVKRLVELWESDECDAYLRRLLLDNREGEREGFPPPVIEEILLLCGVHRRRNQLF